MHYRLGADIGGTFTDIVLLDPDGGVHSKKVLSTPDDYARAIQEGTRELLDEIGVAPDAVREFSHGTTVATNAIIERKGVRVGLITTEGFRDVLEIGRFRLPKLYDMSFVKPEPLVERRLRLGVRERIGADGSVVTPLDTAALDAAADALAAAEVDAVAVCFMNAYVNPEHEQAAAAALRERLDGIAVTASCEIVPQIQEYERTSTTVVNAYIRPVVEHYVQSLKTRMKDLGVNVPVMIMQSSGGVLAADKASESPVFIIESGPAAGVVGAQRLGDKIGERNVMVLDMGGTTAKAALIEDGDYDLTPEIEVGGMQAGQRLIQGAGYIVQFPTIDIAEVGAGGGSIAWRDPGGGMQVGPHSAGASPGPVCYDLGGTEPTVTDANLILGYINPGSLVGGDLKVNADKAKAAIAGLGESFGLDATACAWGIHRIANANMMRALRGVSTERGRDPRNFSLFAIGGNGPVHAAGLAEALEIDRILVPPVAGLFSALGLIFADVEHQSIAAFYHLLEDVSADDVRAAVAPGIEEVGAALAEEGFTAPETRDIRIYAQVQYQAQASSLTVALPAGDISDDVLAQIEEAFHQEHERTYGYRCDGEPIQVISLKSVGRGLIEGSRVPGALTRDREESTEAGSRQAYFGEEHGWQETRLMPRTGLKAGAVAGPLIVEEYDCTTVVPPGWTASLDEWNNIVVAKEGV